MIITTSKNFDKQFKKQPKNTKEEFQARVDIFISDMNNRILNVHKLSGKLKDLWSFNVSGDIRVIFDKSQKDIIVFVAIGSHSELY